MKTLKLLLITLLLNVSMTNFAQNYTYEMRTYTAQPGKLQALLNRFETQTMALIEKHGIQNIGYWVPINNTKNQLIYIVKHKEGSDIAKTWAKFGADPTWKKIVKETEKNGRLVESVVSNFMTLTDYSPNNLTNKGNRVFELRKYKASPFNLGLLDARFRNHTLALFEKHGMENIIYFHTQEPTESLWYLICHSSEAAAKASFGAFGKDTAWVEAKTASEKLAKGSITATITSEFLLPTSFSQLK